MTRADANQFRLGTEFFQAFGVAGGRDGVARVLEDEHGNADTGEGAVHAQRVLDEERWGAEGQGSSVCASDGRLENEPPGRALDGEQA